MAKKITEQKQRQQTENRLIMYVTNENVRLDVIVHQPINFFSFAGYFSMKNQKKKRIIAVSRLPFPQASTWNLFDSKSIRKKANANRSINYYTYVHIEHG